MASSSPNASLGRSQTFILIFLTFVVLIGVLNWYSQESAGDNEKEPLRKWRRSRPLIYLSPPVDAQNEIGDMNMGIMTVNLATVVCGDTEMLNVLLKSAIIFSQDVHLHIIVFTDPDKITKLNSQMLELQKSAIEDTGTEFTFEVNLSWFPNDPVIKWKDMRKACTTQRLFFPSTLTHIDSLIYLDVDTVVVGNLSTMWSEFYRMDKKQMLAAAPDTVLKGSERYKKSVGFPYYGESGVNAGVLLMNLTRLRLFDFERKIIDVYRQYTDKLTFADQDMINILMHDNPDKMMPLSCIYNFYYTFCTQLKAFCGPVKTDGVYILHGASGRFQKGNNGTPFLKMAYNLMKEFKLNSSPRTLFMDMQKKYDELKKKEQCGPMTSQLLTQNAIGYLENLEDVTS